MCAMAQSTSEHQESTELLRTPLGRSSQNTSQANFRLCPGPPFGAVSDQQGTEPQLQCSTKSGDL
jgi:hypothetical protein